MKLWTTGCLLILTSFVAVAKMTPVCVGCAAPVEEDWRNDKDLNAVVTATFGLLTEFIRQKDILGSNSQAANFDLVDVTDLRTQVVAGQNYFMDMTLSYSNPEDPEVDGRQLVCKNVKVFKPLPFACPANADLLHNGCLELTDQEHLDCAAS